LALYAAEGTDAANKQALLPACGDFMLEQEVLLRIVGSQDQSTQALEVSTRINFLPADGSSKLKTGPIFLSRPPDTDVRSLQQHCPAGFSIVSTVFSRKPLFGNCQKEQIKGHGHGRNASMNSTKQKNHAADGP